MNPLVGWALAGAALVAGWFSYRGAGLALAFTVIVFWLLLQFNRSLRVMREAAAAPVGSVPSAVMLHAKLRPGLPMLQIVRLASSLGRRLGESPGPAAEVWAWADEGGAEVRIVFERGRCASWHLSRPDEPATPAC